ncbi:MAG: dTDP-4-amino-4,6-dideoxygalactose transaminase [bacterium]
MTIKFNKPFADGKELKYISEAIEHGHLSGNGPYTKRCQAFFEERYNFNKCLLTTSCTDALEMTALLLNINPNDEIIIPSYTFVSSALAFVRQGAKIVFCDSRSDHPGLDENLIESHITSKTKAIVVVHYAGVAVNMDKIVNLAERYNIFIIEDAAQAIDSYYNAKPLGGIGHFGCFSFHETKNIQCGEGGLLVINDEKFVKRSEIIWEKGTNRADFFRGEVNKYGWVDIGSSFLPSEINAAFLWSQLEKIDEIQEKRKKIWYWYWDRLKSINDFIDLPYIPEYSTNNAHMFYILCKKTDDRDELLQYLKKKKIKAVFHYLSLHSSSFAKKNFMKVNLPNSDYYMERLIRLPFYFDLSEKEVDNICKIIRQYFKK